MKSIEKSDTLPTYHCLSQLSSHLSSQSVLDLSVFVALFFCRPLAWSEELHLEFVALGEDEPKHQSNVDTR